MVRLLLSLSLSLGWLLLWGCAFGAGTKSSGLLSLLRDNASTLLLFGDSLTEGSVTSKEKHWLHPYSIHLTELLRSQGCNATVVVSARAGERLPKMQERIHVDLATHKPAVVVLLGGH